MKPRASTSARLGAVATIALIALVGCGRLNRAATINRVTTTSGAAVATALEQHLASHGLAGAHVTCSQAMIVNVGTRTSCILTGAGKHGTVRFTFKTSHGEIDPASVKPSS
jgi:hypothetical protein